MLTSGHAKLRYDDATVSVLDQCIHFDSTGSVWQTEKESYFGSGLVAVHIESKVSPCYLSSNLSDAVLTDAELLGRSAPL